MKNFIIFGGIVFFMFIEFSMQGQSNTYPYPASGKIGIGTTNPKANLHIYEAPGTGGTTLLLDAAPGKNPNITFSTEGVKSK